MRTFRATVLATSQVSMHLRRVTLGGGGMNDFETTDIPDEYTRVLIAPPGEELALPEIGPDWTIAYPAGAVEPAMRVYTISDFRIIGGAREIDLDVVVHEGGIGSEWATTAAIGDEVGVLEPHGLYAASDDVGWQLLVADHTGLPAVSRILRGLSRGQRVHAEIVLTDPGDQIVLPTAADATINWIVANGEAEVGVALIDAVRRAEVPAADRYVWFAGVAHASRAVRKHLRRELGWPQSDFYTCGYWQFDAEKWQRRYEERQAEIEAQIDSLGGPVGQDHGAYLDELEDIYESAGL